MLSVKFNPFNMASIVPSELSPQFLPHLTDEAGNSMTSIRHMRFPLILTLVALWTNGTSQTDLTTLRQKNWYSDRSLTGNRRDTLLLTDSEKPYQYEIKFQDNGDFYFSIILSTQEYLIIECSQIHCQ